MTVLLQLPVTLLSSAIISYPAPTPDLGLAYMLPTASFEETAVPVIPALYLPDASEEILFVGIVTQFVADAFLAGSVHAETEAQPAAPTADVERATTRLRDPSVAKQAKEVLARIDSALKTFDLVGLPTLRGIEHDDDSFTIEWRFPDRRFAFTIEHDAAESGWHLVSSRSSDDVQACGALPDKDLRPLLGWALRPMPSA